MKVSFLFLLIALVACTKKGTPDDALHEYMIGLKPSQTKDYFLERTTGKLNAVIDAMTEEEFKSFVDTSNLVGIDINILHRNCKKNKCFLTYEVKYKQKSGEEGTFENESKKIAEFVEEEGQWLISDVTNLKSFIESKTPIDVSP